VSDAREIASRYGIPHLAHKRVGETAEELEADAAAKAGLIRLLSPRDLNEEPPEPPIEGLPPRDKPAHEYTPEEWEAQHAHTQQVVNRRERDEQAERERQEAQANRTPQQQMGDLASALLQPGVKQDAYRRLVESLHPDTEGDEAQ
jgi:hypothetical protein